MTKSIPRESTVAQRLIYEMFLDVCDEFGEDRSLPFLFSVTAARRFTDYASVVDAIRIVQAEKTVEAEWSKP